MNLTIFKNVLLNTNFSLFPLCLNKNKNFELKYKGSLDFFECNPLTNKYFISVNTELKTKNLSFLFEKYVFFINNDKQNTYFKKFVLQHFIKYGVFFCKNDYVFSRFLPVQNSFFFFNTEFFRKKNLILKKKNNNVSLLKKKWVSINLRKLNINFNEFYLDNFLWFNLDVEFEILNLLSNNFNFYTNFFRKIIFINKYQIKKIFNFNCFFKKTIKIENFFNLILINKNYFSEKISIKIKIKKIKSLNNLIKDILYGVNLLILFYINFFKNCFFFDYFEYLFNFFLNKLFYFYFFYFLKKSMFYNKFFFLIEFVLNFFLKKFKWFFLQKVLFYIFNNIENLSLVKKFLVNFFFVFLKNFVFKVIQKLSCVKNLNFSFFIRKFILNNLALSNKFNKLNDFEGFFFYSKVNIINNFVLCLFKKIEFNDDFLFSLKKKNKKKIQNFFELKIAFYSKIFSFFFQIKFFLFLFKKNFVELKEYFLKTLKSYVSFLIVFKNYLDYFWFIISVMWILKKFYELKQPEIYVWIYNSYKIYKYNLYKIYKVIFLFFRQFFFNFYYLLKNEFFVLKKNNNSFFKKINYYYLNYIYNLSFILKKINYKYNLNKRLENFNLGKKEEYDFFFDLDSFNKFFLQKKIIKNLLKKNLLKKNLFLKKIFLKKIKVNSKKKMNYYKSLISLLKNHENKKNRILYFDNFIFVKFLSNFFCENLINVYNFNIKKYNVKTNINLNIFLYYFKNILNLDIYVNNWIFLSLILFQKFFFLKISLFFYKKYKKIMKFLKKKIFETKLKQIYFFSNYCFNNEKIEDDRRAIIQLFKKIKLFKHKIKIFLNFQFKNILVKKKLNVFLNKYLFKKTFNTRNFFKNKFLVFFLNILKFFKIEKNLFKSSLSPFIKNKFLIKGDKLLLNKINKILFLFLVDFFNKRKNNLKKYKIFLKIKRKFCLKKIIKKKNKILFFNFFEKISTKDLNLIWIFSRNFFKKIENNKLISSEINLLEQWDCKKKLKKNSITTMNNKNILVFFNELFNLNLKLNLKKNKKIKINKAFRNFWLKNRDFFIWGTEILDSIKIFRDDVTEQEDFVQVDSFYKTKRNWLKFKFNFYKRNLFFLKIKKIKKIVWKEILVSVNLKQKFLFKETKKLNFFELKDYLFFLKKLFLFLKKMNIFLKQETLERKNLVQLIKKYSKLRCEYKKFINAKMIFNDDFFFNLKNKRISKKKRWRLIFLKNKYFYLKKKKYKKLQRNFSFLYKRNLELKYKILFKFLYFKLLHYDFFFKKRNLKKKILKKYKFYLDLMIWLINKKILLFKNKKFQFKNNFNLINLKKLSWKIFNLNVNYQKYLKIYHILIRKNFILKKTIIKRNKKSLNSKIKFKLFSFLRKKEILNNKNWIFFLKSCIKKKLINNFYIKNEKFNSKFYYNFENFKKITKKKSMKIKYLLFLQKFLKIKINYFYFISDLKKENLLNLTKLQKKNNLKIKFYKRKCWIKNKFFFKMKKLGKSEEYLKNNKIKKYIQHVFLNKTIYSLKSYYFNNNFKKFIQLKRFFFFYKYNNVFSKIQKFNFFLKKKRNNLMKNFFLKKLKQSWKKNKYYDFRKIYRYNFDLNFKILIKQFIIIFKFFLKIIFLFFLKKYKKKANKIFLFFRNRFFNKIFGRKISFFFQKKIKMLIIKKYFILILKGFFFLKKTVKFKPLILNFIKKNHKIFFYFFKKNYDKKNIILNLNYLIYLNKINNLNFLTNHFYFFDKLYSKNFVYFYKLKFFFLLLQTLILKLNFYFNYLFKFYFLKKINKQVKNKLENKNLIFNIWSVFFYKKKKISNNLFINFFYKKNNKNELLLNLKKNYYLNLFFLVSNIIRKDILEKLDFYSFYNNYIFDEKKKLNNIFFFKILKKKINEKNSMLFTFLIL